MTIIECELFHKHLTEALREIWTDDDGMLVPSVAEFLTRTKSPKTGTPLIGLNTQFASSGECQHLFSLALN